MRKNAVSVTLSPDNLLWLRARTLAERNRSLSETLDRLLTRARSGADGRLGSVRSVVGSVTIGSQDPDLSSADTVVRDLFARSLARTGGADESGAWSSAGRVAEKRRRG